MRLLSNLPVEVGALKVYPIRLGEINEIGYEKYNEYIYSILFGKKNVEVTEKEISDFDVIIQSCHINEYFKDVFSSALKLFLKCEIKLDDEIIADGQVIDSNIFEEIKKIIKLQNFINEESEQLNPANARAKSIAEKLKKAKERVAKVKKTNTGLTLLDLITNVSSLSYTINLLNVWDMTVYQIYTHFNKLIQKENYEQQFSMCLQGADIKLSDVKHWTT